MIKRFNVGIKGVVVSGDKVLILRSERGWNGWEIPGGRIDGDESIPETLDRELKEELPNIKDIKVGKILDAYRIHKDIDNDVSLTLIFFKVTATFDGEPEISDEHLEYKWATKDEAVELVADSCKNAVAQAFN